MAMDDPDARRDAPAVHRNREAILAVLKKHIRRSHPHVLEIASGTGQHAVYFAEHWPEVTWWPSDIDAASLASINAWRIHSGRENVQLARRIDVMSQEWLSGEPLDIWSRQYHAIFSANMTHISAWPATEGLITGAGKWLAQDGLLIIYGPFSINGEHTSPSNEDFDASLKDRNPDWGIRDLSQIQEAAVSAGLELAHIENMPANNLSLVLRQS